MADETLSWDLVFDVKTGKLRPATGELRDFAKASDDASQKLLKMEIAGRKMLVNLGTELPGRLEKAGANVRGLASDLALAAKGFAVMGAAIGGGLVLLDRFTDKAIKAFGERQASLRAYTTLLGDSRQAELEFSKAQQLSQKTDLTSAQVESTQKALMVAGFRGRDLDAALLGGLDVASMAAPEQREQALRSYSSALGKIKGADKLSLENLNQLSEGSGLSQKLVKDAIAQQMGLKSTDAVSKAISSGQVKGDVGVSAIQQAVLKQFGTSKLGEFATGSSGSLTSAISNQEEAWDNLLKSINSEAIPGIKLYQKSLEEAAEGVSLQSESGQNLALVLQDLSSTGAGLKAAWTDFSTGFLEVFGETYTAALKDTSGDLTTLAGTARSFGEALGQVGSTVAWMQQEIVPAIEHIIAGLHDFGRVLANPLKWIKGELDDPNSPEAVAARIAESKGDAAAGNQDVYDENGLVSRRRRTDQIVEEDGQRVTPPSAAEKAAAAAKKAAPAPVAKKRRTSGKGGGVDGVDVGGWDFGGGPSGGALAARDDVAADVMRAANTVVPPDVNITLNGDVHIPVTGVQDPHAVADAVYDRFVAKIGRMAHTPAPRAVR